MSKANLIPVLRATRTQCLWQLLYLNLCWRPSLWRNAERLVLHMINGTQNKHIVLLQALAAANKSFVTTDYMLPTPKWAVYGADEAGFDPQEIRFKKIRNHPKVPARMSQ